MSGWDVLIACASLAWGVRCGIIIGRATERSARIAQLSDNGGSAHA